MAMWLNISTFGNEMSSFVQQQISASLASENEDNY